MIFFIAPSEPVEEHPMSPRRSSVLDKPKNFQRLKETTNTLEDLDSFPDDEHSSNQLHRIVKKQMSASDYNRLRKTKRSVADLEKSFGGDGEFEGDRVAKRKVTNFVSRKRHYRTLRSNLLAGNVWKRIGSSASNPPDKANDKTNGISPKAYFEDWGKNRWSYYQWETHPRGYKEPRSERDPRGLFSSHGDQKSSNSGRRSTAKQTIPFDPSPEEAEPSNEWLDATKSVIQKIPSEFKPKKKPNLKIYHLRVKRKLDDVLQNGIVECHHKLSSKHFESHKKGSSAMREKMPPTTHSSRRHLPRSFAIHVNKNEEKDDDKIPDNYENATDEEEDEDDEEDDDEEDDEDVEDETEEDEVVEVKQTPDPKESFKDLLKLAEALMGNKVKLDEISGPSQDSKKPASSAAESKKSEETPKSEPKESKKVLIDANIKVDSAIGKVLKSILKSKDESEKKSKTKIETQSLVGDRRGSPDRMDPEFFTMHGHFMRSKQT